jgi:hypothetical protein
MPTSHRRRRGVAEAAMRGGWGWQQAAAVLILAGLTSLLSGSFTWLLMGRCNWQAVPIMLAGKTLQTHLRVKATARGHCCIATHSRSKCALYLCPYNHLRLALNNIRFIFPVMGIGNPNTGRGTSVFVSLATHSFWDLVGRGHHATNASMFAPVLH